MKFINYLQDITGISIYPLISLIIFFLFFTIMSYYVYKTPKNEMQQKGHLPLEQ